MDVTSTAPPLSELLNNNNNTKKDEGQGVDMNANMNANPRSGMRVSSRRSIPSPITSAKANTAADNRAMRRIIAEDPEWSLATVPLLTELCVTHIVGNFAEHPKLNEMPPKYKAKVLEKIAVSLPLRVVAHLVTDEGYWQRRCKASWKVCDVSKYGSSWKRMFFERHLEYMIEHFVPESTDTTEMIETLPLASPYVRHLNIKQLLPPVKEELIKTKDDTSDTASDAGSDWDGPRMDHFDFTPVVQRLPSLEKFQLTYGVRDCGMNFEWNLFQFTQRDCLGLSKCLRTATALTSFQLHRSKVDDDKARVLISHLLDHPSLKELDLSHNIIGDSGARGIGKLLNGRSQLVKLNLSNNKIRGTGAAAIGHALKKNITLRELNLGLNRLGDEGGQALCKALMENSTLEHLILTSNELSEPTAAAMAQVAIHNTTLQKVSLSCNALGQDGGKQLQEGMEENSTIIELDLRLTEVGQESEYCINQILKKNKEDASREIIP